MLPLITVRTWSRGLGVLRLTELTGVRVRLHTTGPNQFPRMVMGGLYLLVPPGCPNGQPPALCPSCHPLWAKPPFRLLANTPRPHLQEIRPCQNNTRWRGQSIQVHVLYFDDSGHDMVAPPSGNWRWKNAGRGH